MKARSIALALLLASGFSPIARAQISPPTTSLTQSGGFIGPATLQTRPSDTISTADAPWVHLLYLEGNVRLAVDPVLDIRTGKGTGTGGSHTGFTNVRGGRWAGRIDDRIDFGGTLLEMQRVPLGPAQDWLALHGGFPGMGTGKLSTTEAGQTHVDHSLSSAWFKFAPAERFNIEWGIGAHRIGPAIYNAVLSDEVAPAPYLKLDWQIAPRWKLHYLQRRLQSNERLEADGVREGRYTPMGLAVRAISYTSRDASSASNATITAMTGRLFNILGRSTEETVADLGFWPHPSDQRSDSWQGISAQINWAELPTFYAQVARSRQHHRWVIGAAYNHEQWQFWVEANGGEGHLAHNSQLPAPPQGAAPALWWNATDSIFTRGQVAGAAWNNGRWTATVELTNATTKTNANARITWLPYQHAPFAINVRAAQWAEQTWWSAGFSSYIHHGRKM